MKRATKKLDSELTPMHVLIQTRIPRRLYDRLVKHAGRSGWSVAGYIRALTLDHLEPLKNGPRVRYP